MSEINREKIYELHTDVFLDFIDRLREAYDDSNIVGVEITLSEFTKWLCALQEEIKCFPPE